MMHKQQEENQDLEKKRFQKVILGVTNIIKNEEKMLGILVYLAVIYFPSFIT